MIKIAQARPKKARNSTRGQKKTRKTSSFTTFKRTLGLMTLSFALGVGSHIWFVNQSNDSEPSFLAGFSEIWQRSTDNSSIDNNGNTDSNSETKSKITKPKFDFYTILPEVEIVVPSAEKPGSSVAKGADISGESQSASDEDLLYVLQLASFKNSADADKLRAQLILQGFDVFVQRVDLDSGERWYRVRTAAFPTSREADKVRQRLHEIDISSLMLKIKDS